jgi:hypothetical protein
MFCYPEHITSSMDQLFNQLGLPAFKAGAHAAAFLDAATSFLLTLTPSILFVRVMGDRNWPLCTFSDSRLATRSI